MGIIGRMPYVPPERGRAIREAYEFQGLTRDAFAKRTGIPPKTITNITCGGWCSRPNAVLIASVLSDWSYEDVFGHVQVGAA